MSQMNQDMGVMVRSDPTPLVGFELLDSGVPSARAYIYETPHPYLQLSFDF